MLQTWWRRIPHSFFVFDLVSFFCIITFFSPLSLYLFASFPYRHWISGRCCSLTWSIDYSRNLLYFHSPWLQVVWPSSLQLHGYGWKCSLTLSWPRNLCIFSLPGFVRAKCRNHHSFCCFNCSQCSCFFLFIWPEIAINNQIMRNYYNQVHDAVFRLFSLARLFCLYYLTWTRTTSTALTTTTTPNTTTNNRHQNLMPVEWFKNCAATSGTVFVSRWQWSVAATIWMRINCISQQTCECMLRSWTQMVCH